jgi:putative radical SAM enzyme (TIGR03279 family)
MPHKIISIDPNSPGKKTRLRPGDILLEINGHKVIDVFDYRYLTQNKRLTILAQRPGKGEFLVECAKREYDDLGLNFETGLMDKAKRCANKCVFCFVDQLPTDMRGTLYFKDDDPRLSFLRGNYVTLTNMSDEEFDRILYYHLSPINISVHSMDPDTRRAMLGNPAAGRLAGYLDRLASAGISMNFQIVLCKGYNDGPQLLETVDALAEYIPSACSVSVVPVGLTRHREGLAPLVPFTATESAEVIRQLEGLQAKFLKKHGTRFVFAADEFFISAGRPIPAFDAYEDFPQLENGVGMAALMEEEFTQALDQMPSLLFGGHRKISIATGLCAYDFIKNLAGRLTQRVQPLGTGSFEINVYPIVNNFFGEHITVSGLLTGRDIIAQLRGLPLGDKLLVPANALREGEDVFLDDITLADVERQLGVTTAAPPDGKTLAASLTHTRG